MSIFCFSCFCPLVLPAFIQGMIPVRQRTMGSNRSSLSSLLEPSCNHPPSIYFRTPNLNLAWFGLCLLNLTFRLFFFLFLIVMHAFARPETYWMFVSNSSNLSVVSHEMQARAAPYPYADPYFGGIVAATYGAQAVVSIFTCLLQLLVFTCLLQLLVGCVMVTQLRSAGGLVPAGQAEPLVS